MKGQVRTKEKCPKCLGKFKIAEKGLTCSKCLTQPKRFFVDIYLKKRIKIYKDESGQVLDSWDRADRLLNHIRWEIDNHQFHPEKYQLKRDCIYGDFDQIVIKRTFTRNNRLRENPKENRWRIISLLDESKEILRPLEISLTGFVFVNKWGRHYSQQYINDIWNDACAGAGFRYIPLKNASRHSLGTKLAMEGYGENIIAKVLGHSDTKTTKNYTKYASESLKPFYKRRNIKKATVHKLSLEDSK